MKEAEIYTGKSKCYFCVGCHRYIPKQESKDPCPFCGEKEWHLKNPLIYDIINTEPIITMMFQTFRHCIEPFTGFEKQGWKNGNIFYKISEEERNCKEDEKHKFKDVEMWCISHHGFGGYFLSLCLRWKEIFIHSDKTSIEVDKLQFLTFKTPKLFYDNNQEKDDSFYFNLIFNEALERRGHISQLSFNAVKEDGQNYKAYAYVTRCGESMTLYPDILLGMLYSEQLAKNELPELMTALDDFTLIPRYWGYKF